MGKQRIFEGFYLLNGESDDYTAVRCEIMMSETNGSFNGYIVQDDFMGIKDLKLSIIGYFEGTRISFVKKFPYALVKDENGKVVQDKSIVGHEVIFEGGFHEPFGAWVGRWQTVLSDEIENNPRCVELQEEDSFHFKEVKD